MRTKSKFEKRTEADPVKTALFPADLEVIERMPFADSHGEIADEQ